MVRFLLCWRVAGRASVAYLVTATVAAPYILCIIVFGLMLMQLRELSSVLASTYDCRRLARSTRILDAVRSAIRPVYPGRGLYGLVPIILGWSAILLAQPFGCRVRFPGFALGFMGVAACETDGIARISLLEHVGDKRLPALIRRLMTEGEARPNGCIDVSRSLPLVVKASPPCRCHANLDNN